MQALDIDEAKLINAVWILLFEELKKEFRAGGAHRTIHECNLRYCLAHETFEHYCKCLIINIFVVDQQAIDGQLVIFDGLLNHFHQARDLINFGGFFHYFKLVTFDVVSLEWPGYNLVLLAYDKTCNHFGVLFHAFVGGITDMSLCPLVEFLFLRKLFE